MPINKSAMLRYRIIDGCLSNPRKRYPDLEDIKEKILDQIGSEISDSMVRKDFQQMKSMGAPIEYHRYHKGYYYTEPGFSMQEFPLTLDEIEALDFSTALLSQVKGTRIFQQFENAINKVIEGYRISKIIGKSESQILQVEEPLKTEGNEWLETILKSIVEENLLLITYNAFGRDAKEHEFSPYLLKEYRNRWYAVGYSTSAKNIVTLALDRIKNIVPTKGKYYNNPDFNPSDFFKYSLGIIQRHTKQPKKIVLSFNTEQAPYIISQPLHHSQKVILDNDDEVQIELNVYITQELKMTILSYGNDVKVLQPEILKKEIRQIIKEMKMSYE